MSILAVIAIYVVFVNGMSNAKVVRHGRRKIHYRQPLDFDISFIGIYYAFRFLKFRGRLDKTEKYS